MPRALVAHPSADVYGSDLQLLESLAGLQDAGWQVALRLPAAGPLVDLVRSQLPTVAVEVAPFPVLRKALLAPRPLLGLLARAPRDLVRLLRVIRRSRPDVVYVNTVTIPLWILAAWLLRVPVLVHVHEAEEDVARPLRIAVNAPLLLARRVVANSRASARVLAQSVPRLASRTTVIVNGVPDRGAAPAGQEQPNQLALVARLSPRKGVDVALEALALLRRQGRPVELEICGTAYEGYEWFEDQLRRRAAEPDLAGAVQFSGYVSPTLPVLMRASVVLVPSRVEPFGNTAVEALMAARPLVASEVQGLAEIIVSEETGLLVPPGDAEALARAIARYLDEPDWARAVARRGRAAALARFGTARYRSDLATAVRALHS